MNCGNDRYITMLTVAFVHRLSHWQFEMVSLSLVASLYDYKLPPRIFYKLSCLLFGSVLQTKMLDLGSFFFFFFECKSINLD